jgi:hypothetical protein
MVLDSDDKIVPHPELSSEQVSGVKIGFGIIAVMAFFIILGLVLFNFCPETYRKLQSIYWVVTED